MNSRRDFLQSMLVAGVFTARGFDPWSDAEAIRRRIRAPKFPKRDFVISRFGAAGDGFTDCTRAIRRAIAACHNAGGGRVVVPAGDYLTGAIHLKSGINLHVSQGATLKFRRDVESYLPLVFTRWEGVELMNFSPFIYAFEQRDIAITGQGTLDGQADCDHWWPWKGRRECGWKPGDPLQDSARNVLFEMAEKGVPVRQRQFGKGSYLRPQFIQPYRCKNVLIEDVTVTNSPMWEIHPVLCTNVTIRGVNIHTHGPNNDGCDPESCTDVLITDCTFDTGDDCIAIKSGRNTDGRRLNRPTENVIVQNCRMKDGHGGVTIGSEASGSVRNIFVEDCTMDSPHLERGLRLKTNFVRGGMIENVFMRNVTIGQVSDAALSIDLQYEEGDKGNYPPRIRNINLTRVTSEKSKYAVFIRGFEKASITGVSLDDCRFDNVAKPNLIQHADPVRFSSVNINGKLVE